MQNALAQLLSNVTFTGVTYTVAALLLYTEEI